MFLHCKVRTAKRHQKNQKITPASHRNPYLPDQNITVETEAGLFTTRPGQNNWADEAGFAAFIFAANFFNRIL